MTPIGLGIPLAAPDVQPETAALFAQKADAAGLHSVWTVDRLAFDNFDPLIGLAAAAAVTRNVRLGTGVLLGTLRPPLVLAKMVATLDRISRGRVILGMGVGSRSSDFDAGGLPFEHRGPRMSEYMQVLRAAWTGEPVQHNGRFYQLNAEPVGPRPFQDRLPICLGGSADAALKRVGRYADGYVGSSSGGLKGFQEKVQTIRRYAEEAGRDPMSITMVGVIYGAVDPSADRAFEVTQRYVSHYYGASRPPVRENYFLGPASECEATIRPYMEGGADVMVLGTVSSDPHGLDLLLEELVPRLRT